MIMYVGEMRAAILRKVTMFYLDISIDITLINTRITTTEKKTRFDIENQQVTCHPRSHNISTTLFSIGTGSKQRCTTLVMTSSKRKVTKFSSETNLQR